MTRLSSPLQDPQDSKSHWQRPVGPPFGGTGTTRFTSRICYDPRIGCLNVSASQWHVTRSNLSELRASEQEVHRLMHSGIVMGMDIRTTSGRSFRFPHEMILNKPESKVKNLHK